MKEIIMIAKKSWKEFRESGLLWWVNTMLHTFGWALCIEIDDDGEISNCYPARVKFRGFGNEQVTDGYINLSKYMKENADELLKESME